MSAAQRFLPDILRRSSQITIDQDPSIAERMLPNCIARARQEVHVLQSQINGLQANLLTISRCIAPLLPPSPCFGSHLYTLSKIVDFHIKQYGPNPSMMGPAKQLSTEISKKDFFPCDPIEGPSKGLLDSLPKRTDDEQRSWLARQRGGALKLELELRVLLLKRTELQAERENLQAELRFWVEAWEDIMNDCESECASMITESNPSMRSLRTNKTLQDISELGYTKVLPYNGQSSISRKQVPVRAMLDRARSQKEMNPEEESRKDSAVDVSNEFK